MMREKVLEELKSLRGNISQQTYKTILGQINAGDIAGASVGIERIKHKLGKK